MPVLRYKAVTLINKQCVIFNNHPRHVTKQQQERRRRPQRPQPPQRTGGEGQAAMMEVSSRSRGVGSRRLETRRVSSEVCFFFVSFYILLTTFTIANRIRPPGVLIGQEGLGKAAMTKNGPKRCQTRRLGPRWVFLLFLFVFFILTNYLLYI